MRPSRAQPVLLATTACAAGLVAACAWVAPGDDLDALAARLHRDAIVVDTHADTTPYFQDPSWRFDERHHRSETHMDLPRIREGGLDVQFWSIYMGRREGDGRAIREALERIDAVRQMTRRHPEVALATRVEELRRQVRAGRFVSMMGIEGGHVIEGSLAALRSFHALGVRYLTLTHSFHTSWADSSGTRSVPEPVHGGLAPFGERVVREMNRLGMMVDVSHVSDETFADVLAVTSAPVIASHSSCRAVADHARNLSDPMLRALAANGGVVMINFYPAYIDAHAAVATTAYYERWRPELERLADLHADDWWGLWLATSTTRSPWPGPITSASARTGTAWAACPRGSTT